jgi:hypothetical protein
MKYTECMIAYDPDTDNIKVGPWPDETGWSDKYLFTVGACYLKMHKAARMRRDIQMMLEFHHAVVRDRVPVDAAHAAFCQIDEYREMMAPDVKIHRFQFAPSTHF